MSESDYIDVLDKPFIYTVGLVIYANSLSGCIQPMSDGTGREFAYLSSHATNRYFIPNWGASNIFQEPKERISSMFAGNKQSCSLFP